MSLKEDIVRINKKASMEKLLNIYGQNKGTLTGLYNCPACKMPLLVLNRDFNLSECKYCGKRFLPISLVRDVENINSETAIEKICLILNLEKKAKEVILFNIWNMCDGNETYKTVKADDIERITSFLISIGIRKNTLFNLKLNRLLNKKITAFVKDSKIKDLLMYDDEKNLVKSFLREKYSIDFLINERKKIKTKKR